MTILFFLQAKDGRQFSPVTGVQTVLVRSRPNEHVGGDKRVVRGGAKQVAAPGDSRGRGDGRGAAPWAGKGEGRAGGDHDR